MDDNRDWAATTVRYLIDSSLKRDWVNSMGEIVVEAEKEVAGVWETAVPLEQLGLSRIWDLSVKEREGLERLVRGRLIEQLCDLTVNGLKARAMSEPIESVRDVLWKMLKTAPGNAFADEAWDALGAAESVCVGMSVRGDVGPDRPLVDEDSVYPMLALALAALHTASESMRPEGRGRGSARRYYTDWDFRNET